MEYAVFKQQIMEQAKRILPQEEGYVITIVDQTEYGLGEMLIINKSDKEVVPGISMEEMYQDFSQNKKSIEEVIIANYLYLNGVNYKYCIYDDPRDRWYARN